MEVFAKASLMQSEQTADCSNQSPCCQANEGPHGVPLAEQPNLLTVNTKGGANSATVPASSARRYFLIRSSLFTKTAVLGV